MPTSGSYFWLGNNSKLLSHTFFSGFMAGNGKINSALHEMALLNLPNKLKYQ